MSLNCPVSGATKKHLFEFLTALQKSPKIPLIEGCGKKKHAFNLLGKAGYAKGISLFVYFAFDEMI